MGLPYYRQESLFDQLEGKNSEGNPGKLVLIASRNYLFPIYELLTTNCSVVISSMQMKRYVRCDVKTVKLHNSLYICESTEQDLMVCSES